jgi:two-component system CheB/CheR fusion protein
METGKDPFIRAIIDSLDVHVSVVDGEGNIKYVNAAWEDFPRKNGDPDLRFTGIGVNYLQVCRTAALDDRSLSDIVI